MKSFGILNVLVILILTSVQTHAQFFNRFAPSVDSPKTNIQTIIDDMRTHLTPADTNEGSLNSKINEFEGIWGIRAVSTDSTHNALYGTNMFTQYAYGIMRDIAAKKLSGCTNNAFSGNWECFGPDTLPMQRIGFVNTVWADDIDTNYILAGTSGGLFKTINGGKKWECLTDNTIIGTGVIDVSCIAVNPLTSPGNGYYSKQGIGMLKSFDGGVTWEQEIIQQGLTLDYGDSVAQTQQIYFTPDTSRLYAFSNQKIFTRLNNGIDTWLDITPPGNFEYSVWKDLCFVPGDQTHFFVCTNYSFVFLTNIY